MVMRNRSVLFKKLAFVVIVIILVSSYGCSMPAGTDQSMVQTQTALGVQATMLAQQAQLAGANMQATIQAQQATMQAQQLNQGLQGTQQALQATINAQVAQATLVAAQSQPATPDLPATQAVLMAQATVNAMNAAQPTQPPPSPQPSGPSLKEWMKNASILLYEDMINNPDAIRVVKKALDTMGLNYKDDGSAKGWLKSDLLSGGPQGEGWDLIIIAAEKKSGVSGEFFEYVNDALNKGSSVILEVWYLDRYAGGTASTILSRCGVEFEKDWASLPPARQVLYPLTSDSPILHQPNDRLTFTNVTDYWAYDWDVGDLIKKAARGDAKLLVGTLATEKNNHGVVASCLDGQLILQTFSTHTHALDEMLPLWENYIYNGLLTRYTRLQQ